MSKNQLPTFDWILERCENDPVLFNDAILNRPPYWSRQCEAAEAVARYHDTVIYSGNAVGKDYLVAGLVPWWLWTRANSLVIVTGPSQAVLGSVTWKEIQRAIESAALTLDAQVSKGIRISPHIVKLANGWHALGFSTTSIERASGHHARDVLVIVEEASGVQPHVWEAISGLKATRLVAIGNPLHPLGHFIDLIRRAERDLRDGTPDHLRVHAIRIPSTESPHAEWDHSPFGLADKTWLEKVYRDHGADSPWCASHVFARIPALEHSALLPEAWLDYATAVPRKAGPRVNTRLAIDLGLGVGRASSVLLVRDDLGILEVVASNTLGLAETACEASRLALKWDVPARRVSYDLGGIGRDFANHLARVCLDDAVGLSGGATPRDGVTYYNLRSEAAWTLRRRLDPTWVPDPRRNPGAGQEPFHIPCGPWWPRLRRELAALTYDEVDAKTRLILKEELKARLGQSPDYADALIQSFAF